MHALQMHLLLMLLNVVYANLRHFRINSIIDITYYFNDTKCTCCTAINSAIY